MPTARAERWPRPRRRCAAGLAAWGLLALGASFAGAAHAAPRGLKLRLSLECVHCGARPARARPAPAPSPGALALRLDAQCVECAAPGGAPPGAEAIVLVSVNHVAKGQAFVWVADDGRLYVRERDFRRWGLKRLRVRVTRIRGTRYVALAGIEGLAYRFDENTLELHIRVRPQAIAHRQVFDLAPQPARGVVTPPPGGAFLNYNLTAAGSDASGLGQLSAASELGLHAGGFLLLNDALVTRDAASGATHATRLSTQLVRDDRATLQRLVLGDFVTTPANSLGSSLRLGGVSLSKNYALNPYAITFPGQIISGTVALPSQIYLYSNGVLVKQETVQPGQFQLQNFVALPGLQVTRVVVRNVLGNEQTIVNPFYFSENLLRKGLDEYSLNAGLARRGFGVASNDYRGLGLAGHYRVGVSDALTLGVSGEALDGRYHLGPSATWRLGLLGTAGASLAYGRGNGTGGAAAALSYAYSSPRLAASLALRAEARDFPQAAANGLGNMRHQLAGSLSYTLRGGRSLALTYLDTDPWLGARSRSSALTYRASVAGGVYLTASISHGSGSGAGNAVLFGLSYTPSSGANPPSYDAQLQAGGGASTQTLQVTGGDPDAAGLAYRTTVTRTSDASGAHTVVDPYAQYNFGAASASAEVLHDSAPGAGSSYRLGLAGALARVGGHWGLARPIEDSFGLVKIDHLAGVPVYANNIEVGRTGPDGTFLIPRLASYFDNPISIRARDLPLDVVVPRERYVVSPAYRSGVFIDFKAHRVHAIAARLVARRGAKLVPFGEAEGEIDAGARKVASIYTGPDGSFYVGDIAPGAYTGRAHGRLGACRFALRVPKRREVVTELGELECADAR